MGKINQFILKLLFGSVFILFLPLLLISWSYFTSGIITLPVPSPYISGYPLVAAGGILLLGGMTALMTVGGGLPMTPFPPERFVTTGVYAITKHPIYAGAVLLSFGISSVTGSSSGFWLVSPVLTLLAVAWVAGFEYEKTEARFGNIAYQAFISLPPSDEERPSLIARFAAVVMTMASWAIVLSLFTVAASEPGAAIPLLEGTVSCDEPLFSSEIIVFLLTAMAILPFLIRNNFNLRIFITDTLWALFFGFITIMIIPTVADSLTSVAGIRLAVFSSTVLYFVIAGNYSRILTRFRLFPFFAAMAVTAYLLASDSTLLGEVIAGICTFLVSFYRLFFWNAIRLVSEKIANSWREWRIGPVRIINHGFYGGAAGFAGTLIAGSVIGEENSLHIFIIMICVIIGAGLWAQFVEGSPKLLRPFGYYGGLFGGIIASIAVSLFAGVPLFTILAAGAVSAPWIQAIGRLRCLVQGCCHGKPSDEKTGIRFTHALSRVNKISGLKGLPLHPTQLYSIGCNIVSGLILIRLYAADMPASFLLGIYLILNAEGRFVEESLRGEAQTPYWMGMRIYQWIAIGNIVCGIAVSMIDSMPARGFNLTLPVIVYSAVIGILTVFASGIDFPESGKRFARLTSN